MAPHQQCVGLSLKVWPVGTHQLVRMAQSPAGSGACSRMTLALTSLRFRPLEAIPPSFSQLTRAGFVVCAVWVKEDLMSMGTAGLKDNLQRLGKVLGESGPCWVFSLAPPPSDSHFRYSSRTRDLSHPGCDQPSFHLPPLFMSHFLQNCGCECGKPALQDLCGTSRPASSWFS